MINDIKKYKELIEKFSKNKVFKINEASDDAMSEEAFTGGIQKDWIIYNSELSNLLCIALHKKDDDSPWKLIEWVNMSNGDSDEILNTISMGYHTMFLASSYRDSYEWVIGEYKYDPNELVEDEYFANLISKDDIWGKSELDTEIDKEEFEKYLSNYFSDDDIMYSGSTI